ncbi:hypothetical protein FOA52_006411 [Chlamydomonas sp. UWO 241]|nr:hypothetical protein FOA52_006411 [Chlamydomonas sp. UWO 241]
MWECATACDTIDRGCLLAVMEAVGVGDGVLAWTRTILTHTYASAEVNGFISEPRRYAAGVRQGCPAAPALFLFLGHALACFLRTCPAVCAGLRTLEAAVPGLWRLPLLSACKEPIWRLWAQAQQIASLVDVVSLLVSRVPGAPMQMRMQSPPARGPAMRPTVRRPALRLLPRLLSLPGPLLLPPLWRRRGGAGDGAACVGRHACRICARPLTPGGLPARVGDTSLRRSFVQSIPVARGANWFLAGGGRRMDEEEATAAAAERIAAAAEDGTSLPVRLATDVVRFLYGGTGRREPADGGVVSASLLNAKPAVGGIGVEPRGGGVLRVLFTVASDAVADTVVRWRHELRRCVDSTAVFDVLSDCEEAQHQALWPAFLAAKVAGKRAQFHRARLVVDGERVPAPAC